MATPTELTPAGSPLRRAIVVGWFSYEQSDYTAGDLLACDVACAWLRDAGFCCDVALTRPLGGGASGPAGDSHRKVRLEQVDPADYSHAVFVCGPFMRNHWEADFLERFAHTTLVGLDLTMPLPLADWQPFDLLFERDSDTGARPDLAFIAPTVKVPRVGLCLVEPYTEADVETANHAIARLLASREMAVVHIDTRLDINVAGLRTPSEVESLIAGMDVLVTTRLHGLVLALKHGIPVVAVDPAPGGGKIVAQANVIGWPHAHVVDTLDHARLAESLSACLTPEARRLAEASRRRALTVLEQVQSQFVDALATPTLAPRRRAAPRSRRVATRRMRVVHVIHDFLPRHTAGSEIYAWHLARALGRDHDVTVLCAEYDAGYAHGHVRWRVHDDVPVVEIVNNWVCETFEDSYRSPVVGARLREVLEVLDPEVLHVHNLLNLSFDLADIARERGIPMVATLHDYTLVCPSGGQRLHRAEAHVCHSIDVERCSRCFPDTAFYRQMAFGRAAPRPGVIRRVGALAARAVPRAAIAMATAIKDVAAPPVSAEAMQTRLQEATRLLGEFELVVAPTQTIGNEYLRLGVEPARLRVSDYGFPALPTRPRSSSIGPLRVGFVGTVVWHKGVHVAVAAMAGLEGRAMLTVHGDLRVDPLYAESLRRQAEGLPVDFAGGFGRDAVSDVFSSLDVLVVPSLWLENSPLVMHEAFMAGVPVVAARIGGMPDLIRDGWNGWLVEPGDPVALTKILLRICGDRALLSDVARRQPRVKSIDEDAADWCDRYIEVLGPRPAASP